MMTSTQPILFFSDAHFGAHPPLQEAEKVRRFEGLLEYAAEINAEVFFLGDLFDFWFEYQHWIPKAPLAVLSAIQRFTSTGGSFHLILGNHDIWATDYFVDDLGVEVHREDCPITRQGLRILLSHGDGKAASDKGYRVIKRILRSRFNIALYRLLPADWAYRLARFFSGQSRELTASRPPKYLPEYDKAAVAYLRSEYDAVVMGHLHQGWVRQLEGGWWVNSGEFYERFNYVILKDGEFLLAAWPPEDPHSGESS